MYKPMQKTLRTLHTYSKELCEKHVLSVIKT
jgi:hypothetical protein